MVYLALFCFSLVGMSLFAIYKIPRGALSLPSSLCFSSLSLLCLLVVKSSQICSPSLLFASPSPLLLFCAPLRNAAALHLHLRRPRRADAASPLPPTPTRPPLQLTTTTTTTTTTTARASCSSRRHRSTHRRRRRRTRGRRRVRPPLPRNFRAPAHTFQEKENKKIKCTKKKSVGESEDKESQCS